MASESDAPSLRRQARAPRKQSPAPVGSRAWTVGRLGVLRPVPDRTRPPWAWATAMVEPTIRGNAEPAPATRPTLAPDNACRDSERRGTGTGHPSSGWLCRPGPDRVRRDEGGDRWGIGSGRKATVPVSQPGDVASRARKAGVFGRPRSTRWRGRSRYPASRSGTDPRRAQRGGCECAQWPLVRSSRPPGNAVRIAERRRMVRSAGPAPPVGKGRARSNSTRCPL